MSAGQLLANKLEVGMVTTTQAVGAFYRDYEADIGGFDIGSKIAYSAQAFLGYRTFVLDHPTVLRLGYRVTSQDFETDDFTGNTFKWDVTQHGPLIGFSMQF